MVEHMEDPSRPLISEGTIVVDTDVPTSVTYTCVMSGK